MAEKSTKKQDQVDKPTTGEDVVAAEPTKAEAEEVEVKVKQSEMNMILDRLTKLEQENTQLKKEKAERTEATSEELEEERLLTNGPAPVDDHDDRQDPVDISVPSQQVDAQGRRIYQVSRLPKKEALEELVNFYVGKKNKMVPRPDQFDPQRNNVVCYCRVVKRDLETGFRVIGYSDMPLWLAATRILEGKAVELISQAEYHKIMQEREREFQTWKSTKYAIKKRELIQRALNAAL